MHFTRLLPCLCAATLLLAPTLPATELRLTGKYSYQFSATRYANPNLYIGATGRRTVIPARYYRTGFFKGGDLKNVDFANSSYMSLEFHRKPFVGAVTGQVLYSAAYYPLPPGGAYTAVFQSGFFKSPNLDGYGSVVLYEFNYNPLTGIPSWLPRKSKDFGSARF